MTSTATTEAAADTGLESAVVIDLGKQKRKAVRALREGRGDLMADVASAIAELQAAGAVSRSAQPVIVIVRQRPRRRGFLPLG